MRRTIALLALLLVALTPGIGWTQAADEIQGTVIAIDPYNSVLVLADGRRVRAGAGTVVLVGGQQVAVGRVSPGSKVVIRRGELVGATREQLKASAPSPVPPATQQVRPLAESDPARRNLAETGGAASARTQSRIVTRDQDAVPYRAQTSETRVVPQTRTVVVESPAKPPEPAAAPATVLAGPPPSGGAVSGKSASDRPWCEGEYAQDRGSNFGACPRK
jgi:hypothetical protein